MTRRFLPRTMFAAAMAIGVLLAVSWHAASAYVGPSFLQLPGTSGGGKGEAYRGWIRVESHYWTEAPPLPEIRRSSDLVFTGPEAPREGSNVLNIAIAHNSPVMKRLLEICADNTTIPELRYAESSDRARHSQEVGFRPASIPEYFEYKLVNTRVTCPAAAGSPEQAFVLKFERIEWVNYQFQAKPRQIPSTPAKLEPPQTSGAHRVFVVTWLAAAVDVSEDQCARFNSKPGDAEYFALMSPDQQAQARASLAEKGGVGADVMPYRGPGQLNVCLLPGVVPDPGHVAPNTIVARGLNLDGAGGSKRHPDYVSPDGEAGIDNQLYSIEGCVKGFQRNGVLPSVLNQGRRDGDLSILIDIGGIDNERNDDRVDVTILYSEDPMAKDGTGRSILPDYTFRLSNSPKFTPYMVRLRGRIVDGVITTDPVPRLLIHQGRSFGMPFYDARMRLRIMPDRSLKGLLGAYLDWRDYLTNVTRRATTWENGAGYQCPAIYNGVRRAADGLRDPVTGEMLGISAAFDVEGVPALIPPSQQSRLGLRNP